MNLDSKGGVLIFFTPLGRREGMMKGESCTCGRSISTQPSSENDWPAEQSSCSGRSQIDYMVAM